MKIGKDFIYEYSDLNPLQTRVKVLKGEFKDLVFEIGGSFLETVHSFNASHRFVFDYTIYVRPPTHPTTKLIGDKRFELFLFSIIKKIIIARRKIKNEVIPDNIVPTITIPACFYPPKKKPNLCCWPDTVVSNF